MRENPNLGCVLEIWLFPKNRGTSSYHPFIDGISQYKPFSYHVWMTPNCGLDYQVTTWRFGFYLFLFFFVCLTCFFLRLMMLMVFSWVSRWFDHDMKNHLAIEDWVAMSTDKYNDPLPFILLFLVYKGVGYILVVSFDGVKNREFATLALAVFSDSSPTTIIIFSTSSFLSHRFVGKHKDAWWRWRLKFRRGDCLILNTVVIW